MLKIPFMKISRILRVGLIWFNPTPVRDSFEINLEGHNYFEITFEI